MFMYCVYIALKIRHCTEFIALRMALVVTTLKRENFQVLTSTGKRKFKLQCIWVIVLIFVHPPRHCFVVQEVWLA